MNILDQSAGEAVRHWYATLMVKVFALLLALTTITIVGAAWYWFATATNSALSLAFWLVKIGPANAALLMSRCGFSRYGDAALALLSWRFAAALVPVFAVVAGAFSHGLWSLAARS